MGEMRLKIREEMQSLVPGEGGNVQIKRREVTEYQGYKQGWEPRNQQVRWWDLELPL